MREGTDVCAGRGVAESDRAILPRGREDGAVLTGTRPRSSSRSIGSPIASALGRFPVSRVVKHLVVSRPGTRAVGLGERQSDRTFDSYAATLRLGRTGWSATSSEADSWPSCAILRQRDLRAFWASRL